jgi:hypothetical protein
MKYFKLPLLILFSLTILASGGYTVKNTVDKKPGNIHHTVYFRLKSAAGSAEEQAFFKASEVLNTIPGVRNFQRLRETSKKNNFDHGFAMEFASQEAYDGYSNHPDHNKFVSDYWVPMVEEFMEIDFVVTKE